MRAEFFRLNYALTECAARRWPVTAENVRMLDALSPSELLEACVTYEVGANGRSAVPYPTRASSVRWPRLGRARRILDGVYRRVQAGLPPRSLKPVVSPLDGARDARVLAAFFQLRTSQATADPRVLREMVAAECRLKVDETTAIDWLEQGQPPPDSVLNDMLANALKVHSDFPLMPAQLLAVLSSWQPLKDDQVYRGLDRYADMCELAVPARSLGQVRGGWLVLLQAFYHLELDTDEISNLLARQNLTISRGQLQSLMNEGLEKLYEDLGEPGRSEVRRKREYFLGPKVAADRTLPDHAAATMIRLSYHLASSVERNTEGFLVQHLSRSRKKEDLPPRVAEYTIRLGFDAIWEAGRAGRNGERPPLPEPLKPLIAGFVAASQAERASKTDGARRFFDLGTLPGRPAGNRDSLLERISDALKVSLTAVHLTPTELSQARQARAVPSGFLQQRVSTHIDLCADCRRIINGVQALGQDDSDLLAEAQRVARQLIGDSFDDWNEGMISWQPVIADKTLPHAAASQSLVQLQVQDPSGKPYTFRVREVPPEGDPGDEWTTEIGCTGDPAPSAWEFRLTFETDEELEALAARGLRSDHYGALSKGRKREELDCLLDLLIPGRYGSNAASTDPVFADVVNDLGFAGRLPGKPVEVSFRVVPS